MADLEYVGPVIDQNTDVSYRAYATQLMTANMTETQINTAITDALASYTNKSYVDTRDALNATQAYIQQQDSLRLKLAQKNINGGVAGLLANGKIDPARATNSAPQRWPRAFWSPAAYHASPVTLSTSTETAVYTCGVTNPGYNYKLLVFGTVDGLSAIDGVQPIVSVRTGGVSGPVIARGRGISDSYNYWAADGFDRTTVEGLGGSQYWDETWIGNVEGKVYVDGSQARWETAGAGFSKHGIFRKSGTAVETWDDWQTIQFRISREPQSVTISGQPGRLYAYGRMNAAKTQYVYFNLMRTELSYGYATSGTEIEVASLTLSMSVGDVFTTRFGTASGKRFFQFQKNSDTPMVNLNDSSNLTVMGPNNRGWGWGIKPGASEFGGVFYDQQEPPAIDWITINDLAPGVDGSSYGPINLRPVDPSTQATLSGNQTLTITVNRSSTSGAVSLTTFKPTLYVMAVPV